MNNPIKPTIKTEILPIISIFFGWLVSPYFYAHFPARVATHWDLAGQANGWSSAGFAAFFFPFLILSIYILMIFFPFIDPKKERYQEFRQAYHIIKDFLILFLMIIYILAGLNGVGYNLPIEKFVPGLVGILFIIIGNYMAKVKLNWFVGARNPWTLSNEEVWNKTNRLAGKVFILGGLLMFLQILVDAKLKLPLFISTILAIVIIPNLYSFIIFQKTKKRK